MLDFVPVLILVFGITAIVRPELVAVMDRHQKAAGTTRRPGEIEMSEAYYAVVRIVGIGLALFGLIFTLRNL
jgi:hypothetical protein